MLLETPITYVKNERKRTGHELRSVCSLLPEGLSRQVNHFHRQIPGFRRSPLKGLANLAQRLGLGGIWVKDESMRLDLQSFKVLGGSYAIYQLIRQRLGLGGQEISYADLTGGELRARLGDLTFAAATDGNHGRGVAWAATQLGFKSVIYVHKHTSQSRIRAIENNGARVVVIDGNYDDAEHYIAKNPFIECPFHRISDPAPAVSRLPHPSGFGKSQLEGMPSNIPAYPSSSGSIFF